MSHSVFKCTKFIFRNVEASNGQISEKRNTKNIQPVRDTVDSKEKSKDILKEYKNTEKRIKIAHGKLDEMAKFIESLPNDNSDRIRFNTFYKEASDKLKKIDQDFDQIKFKKGNESKSVDKQIDLDIEKIIADFSQIEKKSDLIVQTIKSLNTAGFSKDEIVKIMTPPINWRINYTIPGLGEFMSEAKKYGVSIDDSKQFWASTLEYKNELISIFQLLHQAGVTSNHYEFFKPFHETGNPLQSLKIRAEDFLYSYKYLPENADFNMPALGAYLVLLKDGFKPEEISRISLIKKDIGSGRDVKDYSDPIEYFRTVKKESLLDFQTIFRLYHESPNLQYTLGFINAIKSGGMMAAMPLINELHELMPSDDGEFAVSILNSIKQKDFPSISQEIMKLLSFKRAHPDIELFNKIYIQNEVSANENRIKIEESIELVDIFNNQPEEIRPFILYIIKTTRLLSTYNIKSFLGDKSLPFAVQIYKTFDRNIDLGMALKLARNLQFRGDEVVPSKEKLMNLMDAMLAREDDVRNIPIFEGRHVVFAAHGERWEDGSGRFISPEKTEDLKTSIGPNGTLDIATTGKDNPSKEELEKTKQNILDKIANTPPPMTFYFNGHGGPRRIYLSKGQVIDGKPLDEDAISIDVTEFAEAVKKRNEKFSGQEDKLEKDIFIFSSCFNQNFIRTFYKLNEESYSVQPIAIGESEFGQYGFSSVKYDANSKEKSIYGLGEKHVTLDRAIKAESPYRDSNISIFAPFKDIPLQITKAGSKSSQASKNA